MSLILDALRKSEAERRKAQAAGDALADMPHPSTSALAGIPVWIWPAAIFAMLALAAAAWLLLARTPATGISDRPAVARSPADLTVAAPVQAPQADVVPAELTGGSPEGAEEVRAVASVAASVATSPAASIPTPAPVPAPATLEAPVRPPAAAVAAPPRPTAANASPSPPSAVASPQATPARETAAAAATPSTPRPTPGNGPLRLSDLGTADRQQLPPLKMSMHMWGPDAAKRFAIIDGTRVGEGDRIGESVVEAIDQEGVVLAWNGLRLRVPVR